MFGWYWACSIDSSFVLKSQNRIEDIKQKQEEEAETVIANQFKMERIVYCQDRLYCEDLQEIRKTAEVLPFGAAVIHVKSIASQKQYSIDEMAYHLNAYFKVSFLSVYFPPISPTL